MPKWAGSFVAFNAGRLDVFGTEEEKPKRTVQIQISFGNQHLYFIGLRLGYLHLFNENDVQYQAGIGNCYSDEICFESKILPTREIQEISDEEINRLYDSMKNVLTNALNHGGYLQNPFFKGDIVTGNYNNLCKVYDREDEPCTRCRTPIKKGTISSRKTFFWTVCQQ